MTIQYWVISTNYKYIFYIIVSKVFNLVFCDVSRQLLQLCQNADHGNYRSSLQFLALQDNKIHCLNFFRRSFQTKLAHLKKTTFFFNIFLGFWVCFCSHGINNFHNARGHYGDISPRQPLITGRNSTGCGSLWPELSKYGYTFDKFINSTRSRKLDRLPPAARQTSEKAWRVRWPLGKRSFAPEVTCVIW